MRIEHTTPLSRRRLLLVKTARKPSFSPARLSYLRALAGNLRDIRTSNSGTSERGRHVEPGHRQRLQQPGLVLLQLVGQFHLQLQWIHVPRLQGPHGAPRHLRHGGQDLRLTMLSHGESGVNAPLSELSNEPLPAPRPAQSLP